MEDLKASSGTSATFARSFWDDINDTAPKPVEYTWWDRYGCTVVRTTVIVGASVVGGVVGSFIAPGAGTAIGAYLGGTLAAAAFGVHDRLEAGQTLGQSIGGGLADGFGVADVYAGRTNRDIATGEELGLSQSEMEVRRFLGYLTVLPTVGVGGRSVARGLRATGLARPVNVVRGGSVPAAATATATQATATAPRTVSLNVLNRSRAAPPVAVGAATKVNITAERTLALLPSKAGAGPLRWQRVSRAPKPPSLHGNRLAATGPHDVYAVRQVGTGRILHIGETGQSAVR